MTPALIAATVIVIGIAWLRRHRGVLLVPLPR
jgi:hypothetical protein